MTTIAYANGIMAADTRTTQGTEFQNGVLKIYNTGKYLVGVAGDLAAGRPVFDWIMQVQDRASDPGGFYEHKDTLRAEEADFTALIVSRDADIWYMEGPYGMETARDFEAIGSGDAYALGALCMGATAPEAVKLAIGLDSGSGGEVVITSFEHAAMDTYRGLTRRAKECSFISVVG